ncbi:Ppx/GppA phosphatase family protein, partial [Anaerovibrio sp.]|uniref:Ppx/GppA phosphatase family protein n=1 Tax=Anaerovibrio sp. TaxID=1872532 RepID=UPI003F14F966
MYTIVDVGSNTIRMNVYDIKDDKLKILFTKKATAGLASFVKDKRMSAAGVDRVVEVLEDFKETLNNLNIPEMHVFATASLRNVENSQEAVAEIERRTGLFVQVLSGREEAELDFLGAAREANVKKGLLVDIGGGSTELVAYKDGKILSAVSIAKG